MRKSNWPGHGTRRKQRGGKVGREGKNEPRALESPRACSQRQAGTRPHRLPAQPQALPGSAAGSHGNRPQTAREIHQRAPRSVTVAANPKPTAGAPWAEVRNAKKRKPCFQPEGKESLRAAMGSLPAPRDTDLRPEGRQATILLSRHTLLQPVTLYI